MIFINRALRIPTRAAKSSASIPEKGGGPNLVRAGGPSSPPPDVYQVRQL